MRHGFAGSSRAAVCLLLLISSCFDSAALAAAEQHGAVTFAGLPVPGATVTATQGDKHFTAITDQQGMYTFAALDDGVWTFQVEMQGFVTQTQMITVGANTPSPTWELKLLPIAELTKGLPPPSTAEPAPASSQPAANGKGRPAGAEGNGAGFQRTTVKAANRSNSSANPNGAPAPANDTQAANDNSGDLAERAATGLLVNGSVNNGAASAFAQMAAFGNNRRGPGSLYNGGLGVIFDTSAWDANPYSVTGLAATKPSYNNVQYVGAFGGPIGFSSHILQFSNFFVGFQHSANDTIAADPGTVPTSAERSGNFSQAVNALGQPLQIFNPATGQPFAGNVIPTGLISPQAQALLALYPLPNVMSSALGYNYQATVPTNLAQNAVQARWTKNFGANNLNGDFAYQGASTRATDLFGFTNDSSVSGLATQVNWGHRFNRGFTGAGGQFFTINLGYQFSRLATTETPYFANRANISGDAGIMGNGQDPLDWGPPNLSFASISGLAEPAYARNANLTHDFSYYSLWIRGRHNVTFGGDVRRQQFDVVSQQNARGTFSFTGAATQAAANGLPVAGTGSDLADFLLGIPDAAQLGFGNADKYLRGMSYDAYITDDWRVNSGLTLNLGVRWEFAEPLTEAQNRLVNLDIAPGFAAAAPVLASDPTGTLTGQSYPASLIRPDYRGIEPRLGLAWRPRPTSPMVVRAGYGVYDNTSVYQVLAMLLAQQPPLSKTLSIQNSPVNPLSLANAFNAVPTVTPNTFAVDPNFRIGYAQDWNVSVQEDLPGSLQMTVTYLGIKGTRLMQESLPNTYPLGAVNPCPACPAGFIYLSSNANSTREAGQIQIRRRLRDGWTATVQYTYAKAIDDASAFSAATLNAGGAGAGAGAAGGGGANNLAAAIATPVPEAPSIAQNWLDLEAERGPSVFDQRHLLNFALQYTSGEGLHGGALLGGWAGPLLKEWTFTTQITVGSGLPLTPVYQTNVAGTGVVGSVRPNYTGAPVAAAPAGLFVNPAAFTAPPPGQWGSAGRDSITGPAQFFLNASIGRTFRLNNRLNATWNMAATNALNHVTYTAYNMILGPQFGLPTAANAMRQLQTTVRLRF